MKKNLLVLLVVFLISACAKGPVSVPPTSTPPPTPTVTVTLKPPPSPSPTARPAFATATPVCVSTEPTQLDIDRALSYTSDVFSTAEWEKIYTVAESRVSVTWMNNPQSAIVFLEALIFPCGYEEPDLNKYYSAESWQLTFANYESYEMVSECKTDYGLRLYEFKAQNLGFTYDIRYWVKNDTANRVISTMIVFPVEAKPVLDEYASHLFPSYITCP